MSNPGPNLDVALEEEGYVRWVQTGTCIGFAKKGLESFAHHRSVVLHQRIKCNIKNTSSFANMCPNISVSRAKYNHTIPGSSNTHNWTMSCFSGCRGCQLYINELVSVCAAGFMFSKNHWENSNITLWPVSEWEVAKVYMNPGLDKNIQTVEDTDLSAILNFIEHCSVPYLAISNKQSIQTFRRSQLLQAQSSDFTITTDAEFRVLRDRALELQKQNKTMQENVKDMQDKCDDLGGKDDEESQTTLAQLVKDIDERENTLQELKSTFSKLEHFASRKRDLKAKMTEHTTITATALFETKEMLTNVKKCYRALTKQEQDIIDEATDQCETVEEKYDALQKLTEALITENKDMKAENLALSTSKTETENSLVQKQQEIDNIKQTLQDCKKDNETMEKNLNSVKVERDQLVADKKDLQKKLDTLVTAKKIQDELINDFRSEKLTLETEIKETKEKLDLSLNKISTLSNNKDELELEIRNLKKQLELYQKELESIKLKQGNEIKELKAQNAILKADLLQERNVNKTVQKEVERLKDENYTLKRKNQQLKLDIEQSNKQLRQTVVENLDLKKRIEELNNQMLHLKEENEDLESEKVCLQMQLAQLESLRKK